MRSKSHQTLVLITALLAAISSSSITSGQERGYQILPFDPPGLASTESRVLAINENSHVVGYAIVSDESYAIHLNTQTNVYTVLSGGLFAAGNNDKNQTVGTATDGTGALWHTPVSDPTPLDTLPGDDYCDAADINNEGVIVGGSVATGGNYRAVAWYVSADNRVHRPVELPPLEGDSAAIATKVTRVFEGTFAIATGESSSSPFEGRATRWIIGVNSDGTLSAGLPEDLGSLGGVSDSVGLAINTDGDVCGVSTNMPFIAPIDGAIQELPAGDAYSGVARDINDKGDIVGQLVEPFRKHDRIDRAYLWNNGASILLQDYLSRRSGWKLSEARIITNGGTIGGTGVFDVPVRGFVMFPK